MVKEDILLRMFMYFIIIKVMREKEILKRGVLKDNNLIYIIKGIIIFKIDK